MATNKNAYIRYQILDECFRNTGRNYHIDDLLDRVNAKLLDMGSDGIRKRQLYDDIHFMKSSDGFSVDLEVFKIGRRSYYRYADPKFSIRNEPINPAEAEHMKSAIQVLSRFSGAPQFEWVEEMLPMLESKFGEVKDKRQIIGYESNVDYEGARFIQPLFHAIHNQRVLHVRYKSFIYPEETYELHPYYLKQYNNRWFVFGRNEAKDSNHWTLALDRIIEFREIDKKYRPSTTDWEEFLYDIVGVTKYEEKEPQEIKLLFHEGKGYIRTKPMHPSQKIKETEAGLEVRITVIPNFELEKLILSYGDQIEVIAPQAFREKIATRIRQAAAYYDDIPQ